MRGLTEAIKVHEAAGAKLIYGPQQNLAPYKAGDNLPDFLRRVREAGMQPNAFALYSAHQMSSCRIGASSALGAISPEGESYEARNLFVADGSVLPTAPGVNPMLPIMGTAHYLAQAMKARL
jgi:choline dehydrogenase-like flavoprotein